MTRFLPSLVCASVLAIVHQAPAQITKVANREALKANTSIEWFAFGADGGFLSTPVSQNFGILSVQLASSSGGLVIAREGTSWKGDFTTGQYLLTQPYASDNFLVSFSPGVSAVGTQIDPGHQQGNSQPYTGPFTARLCLYDTHGTFLGSVQANGTAGTGADNSAKFIGARSAGAPIGLVSLQVSGITPGFTIEGDQAANRMDVVAPLVPPPAVVATVMPRNLPACAK